MGRKLNIAFYWAASCGGCEAVFDINEKILDVVKVANIVFWPIALDIKHKDVEAMPANSSKTASNLSAQWMTQSCSESANNHLKAWGSEKELGMGIEPIGFSFAKETPVKERVSIGSCFMLLDSIYWSLLWSYLYVA